MNLKEEIRKTQELQFGVNLTPKKELETKKNFLDALDFIEKSLDKFNMDYEDVDEDDDFWVEKIQSNNAAIDEINSFLTDIKLKLRFVENLY